MSERIINQWMECVYSAIFRRSQIETSTGQEMIHACFNSYIQRFCLERQPLAFEGTCRVAQAHSISPLNVEPFEKHLMISPVQHTIHVCDVYQHLPAPSGTDVSISMQIVQSKGMLCYNLLHITCQYESIVFSA